MVKLEKVKGFLEWVEHAWLLAEIAAAIGGGKLIKAMLVTFTHVSSVWINAIEWSSAAALLVVMVSAARLRKKKQPSSQTKQVGNVALTSNPGQGFDSATFFRLAYYSPLQAEAERNIRIAAEATQPADREGFYLKVLGIGVVAYSYDLIWYVMYRSQLLALLELNRSNGYLAESKVREFYDQAALEYAEEYRDISFGQWLLYMTHNALFFRHPSEMIEITVKGKDFLKYLLHWGREPKHKRL